MSFYLAIIFDSAVQAAASFAHLPAIISAILSSPRGAGDLDRFRIEALVVTSLIFHLAEAFPAQMMFHRQMESLKCLFDAGDKGSLALEWISSIRASINCRNYSKFEVLTRGDRVRAMIESMRYLTVTKGCGDAGVRQLGRIALSCVVDELRRQFRRTVWTILRSAYRDFALVSETDTNSWLARSLFLESSAECVDAQGWLEKCEKDGHAVRKDGSRERWIIRR